jgi:ppGpp synthetase/RelA/SpoT-type nucleotidyltranferase
VPRAFTSSQIKKLGDRLRRSAEPKTADLQMLQRLREEHDPVLQRVEQALRSHLELEVASRLKTVGTIIDKLKREGTRLNTMQDIAGVRTVAPTTLVEQDAVVESIRAALSGFRSRQEGEAKPRLSRGPRDC